MRKYTDWFPVSIKPVRKGVYQRKVRFGRYSSDFWYAYWNGRFWCPSCPTPEEAKRKWRRKSLSITMWRGLVFPGFSKPEAVSLKEMWEDIHWVP